MDIKENRKRDKLVKEGKGGLEKRTISGGLNCFKSVYNQN